MKIDTTNTILLVIDLQEKLVKAMADYETTQKKAQLLIESAKILGVPTIVTEQYPQGLGATTPNFSQFFDEKTPIIAKTSFSCCGSSEFMDNLNAFYEKTIIICGIEAHVCVLQTALELQAENYNVIVAADATSSRNPDDKKVALEFLAKNNIEILNSESLVFMLLKDAKNPAFKEISKLLK